MNSEGEAPFSSSIFFDAPFSFSFLSLNTATSFHGMESSIFRFSSAGPAGKTGAPGEGNCTNCHAGSTQDGSSVNLLTVEDGATPVTSYIPGTTYSVSLVLNDQNIKEGFSATVLDGTNTMAGSFPGSGLTGTSVSTFNARDYATHTNASNTNSNVEWVWDWTAPASDVGTVTFYVASNIANGNGTSSGDVIYLSQHDISADPSAELAENEITNTTIGYNSSKNTVVIDYECSNIDDVYINIVDLNGRSVFTKGNMESKIGTDHKEIKLPNDLRSGIYVVNFFIGNTPSSQKIYIQ